jgi:CHAD domain-containing protein
METPRYGDLLDAFRRAIDELGPFEGDATATGIAKDALRRLRRAADALPAEPEDAELHTLRIDAKRARYAAELAALGGLKAAARTVEALKQLQDVLGEHQDAVVAEERLRSVARTDTAVAAGRLIERERQRKVQMRARYPDAVRAALRTGQKAFS